MASTRVRRQWLIDARGRARLSQEKLAQAVGVDSVTVSRWERGVIHTIELRHHEPLVQALDITLEELDQRETEYQNALPAAEADQGLPIADTFPVGQMFSPMLPTAVRATSLGRIEDRMALDMADAINGMAAPRGVVVAEVDGERVAVDARRARRHLSRSTPGAPLLAPAAYVLDELTVGIAWAVANLDEPLLSDDARLHAVNRKLAGSSIASDVSGELHPVTRMWLGSAFCARHILDNMNQLAEPPSFWTQERRGEQASNWLLFAHKLAYLRTTATKGKGAEMRRAFCIPAETVAATSTPERVLLLLAAALIESFGIETAVCTESGYTAVEGFVFDGDGHAIVASWVGVEGLWHVSTTRERPTIRGFADALGHARTHSVTAASTPLGRLRALADYLSLNWGWLVPRCNELGEHGAAGVAEPCSRLLSTAGIDRACQFVGGMNEAA